MKPILIASVIVLALCSIAGCAATPEDRWFQQREALTAANRIYLANLSGMSSDEIVRRGELLQAARASLDEARTRLPEGGPAFDTALDVVESILVRLAQPAERYEPPVAPTDPAVAPRQEVPQ